MGRSGRDWYFLLNVKLETKKRIHALLYIHYITSLTCASLVKLFGLFRSYWRFCPHPNFSKYLFLLETLSPSLPFYFILFNIMPSWIHVWFKRTVSYKFCTNTYICILSSLLASTVYTVKPYNSIPAIFGTQKKSMYKYICSYVLWLYSWSGRSYVTHHILTALSSNNYYITVVSQQHVFLN